MILHSLVDYYQALEAHGGVSRPGWAKVKVSYALEIDENGGLVDILPLMTNAEGKKKARPREMELPAPVVRTVGEVSNFLWDNASYFVGIDAKGNPEKTKKRFLKAKELHLSLLSEIDDAFAKAICSYFSTWDIASARQNPIVNGHIEELESGANLVFMFREGFPPDKTGIKAAWQHYYDSSPEYENVMRCLVSGELTEAMKTHPPIKGVMGAQSSGATLVSFNAPAYCSYGHEQNINAPVGKYAAFAYTTALNSLLSDREHTKIIGDTTVVYWAEDADTQTQDAFACILDGGDTVSNADLDGFMTAISQGRNANWNGLPVFPDNRFYVLGLSPNAARLSVRFFLQDTFGGIVKHIKEHYDRLEVAADGRGKRGPIPLWALLRETVNPKSSSKAASPQMAGDTLRAILTGGPYPATLYQQTQLRIRSDRNIPHEKAAIIKAYLIKNTQNENNKEALTVELNETTTYQPYILGRLFSVLEAIQLKANPGINSTIKDKYFTSACATPSVVFPTLLKLAESHMKKLEAGMRIYYAKQLGGLTSMLTESFPAHMNLNDQGIFQLGYYHQTQKRFEKKDKTETVEIK